MTSTTHSESSSAWPKYGQINFSSRAPAGPALLGRLPGMGRQAIRLRQLPAGRAVRQLALQRQGALQAGQQRRRLHYVTYRVRLSRQTERGHVRPGSPEAHRGDAGPRSGASSCRARTSGSRRPTTTRAAAARSPTGSTRPTPESSVTAPPRRPPRPRSIRRTATSRTPRRSRWPTPRLRAARPRTGARRRSQPPTARPSTPSASTPPPTPPPTRAASAASARRGPRSPWGTLDQGGNAVEWTDTITAPPFGIAAARASGGACTAGCQTPRRTRCGPRPSALQPQDNAFYAHTYPWLGFRIGYIG